jgi:sulfatase modifying factor 1
MDIEWVLVAGGTCRFGDRGRPVVVGPLWWTATVVTYGCTGTATDEDVADLPVTRIDHAEADAMARSLGGRLPRSVEWEWMAAGPELRAHPWGDEPWRPALANLRDSGYGRPVAVGSHPAGATPEGLLDVAGNVWEWTASPVLGDGAVIRGGSCNSLPLYARSRFLNAAPRWLRSRGIGFRVVREP